MDLARGLEPTAAEQAARAAGVGPSVAAVAGRVDRARVHRHLVATRVGTRAVHRELDDRAQLAGVEDVGAAGAAPVDLDTGLVAVLAGRLAVVGAFGVGTGLDAVLGSLHRVLPSCVSFARTRLTGKAASIVTNM